ncbi:MAG: hypothetical protein AAGK01_05490 [Pseudomonadota bacterium]
MKTGILCAATLLVAPFMAGTAFASDPETQAVEAKAMPETGTEASEEAEKPKAEEKRICRRVRLDASSRRGTKVCKTKDEWREFNQRR